MILNSTERSTARRYLDERGAADAFHEVDPSAYYAGSQHLRQIIEKVATVHVLKGREWPAHGDLYDCSLVGSFECDPVRPGSSADRKSVV